jgi:hypothetical protein
MPRGVPGPVKKTASKRKPNSGSFTMKNPRPGPGRPKGVLNKFTEELKQTILDALHNANDEGLFLFVRDTAVETPTAAMAAGPPDPRLDAGQGRADVQGPSDRPSHRPSPTGSRGDNADEAGVRPNSKVQ